MVIDTSVVIALLEGEPEALALAETMRRASFRRMSAASVVEAYLVAIHRRGAGAETDVELLFARAGIDIVPVTAAHVRIARDGFLRFGKGRHAAGLNFGDCFSYALAVAEGQPLLFKGNDFGLTDVGVAPLVEIA